MLNKVEKRQMTSAWGNIFIEILGGSVSGLELMS